MRLRLFAVLSLAAICATIVPAARSTRVVCGWETKPPARWHHIVWIWMENESFHDVVGTASARYLTTLSRECGVATDYSAVSHPSLPNYIAATSGSTWGIADDGSPASHPISRPSIFSQVSEAGLTWRSYEESMPSTCDLANSGGYAVRHNPAAYYVDIRGRCRRWDLPMGTTSSGSLASDLARNRLPAFSFLTPNVCDDMHDCPIATGDAWLHRWIPTIVSSAGYQSGTTVLFITFDEGTTGSNRVATIVLSPSTRPAATSATPFDHYSLLKTTEQLLGLRGRLAHAGDSSTHDMRSAFNL